MYRDKYTHELAERSGKTDSKAMHKILELAMTEDEARFILELPAPTEELAAKFKMDTKAVEEKILAFAQRGLLSPSGKGYHFNNIPAIFHDNILSSKPQYIPDKMSELWMELYKDEKWYEEIGEMYNFFTDPILRVVPAEKSLPQKVELLPYESITKVIEANRDLISVRNCCCRTGANSCDHPRDVCIQFKSRAEYDLYRGSGRKISVDEAVAISHTAADSGLVPTVTNLSLIGKLEFFCFCCNCACLVLDPGVRTGTLPKILSPSRFRAKINSETCKSCKLCTKRCQFGAIEMQSITGHDKQKAVLDPDKCLGCGICELTCVSDSITMETVRQEDFIPETIADEAVLHL
jgi:formate hydrogenlyase subunit 6/NADH:ubiquinone oxidoreductase subunit I